MYKEFYGLTTFPFSLTADPQFLYLSASHEDCLLYLLHGLEREYGLIVMTGPIGTGKTFLLNTLVQRLGNKAHVAYVVNPKLDPTGMLQYASQEFRLEISGKSKAELLINLKNFLIYYPGQRIIIIVDEAHNLSVDVLEELRLLTNFETSEKKLIQIILAGQPQLEELLQLPELAQLNQRIGMSCRLLPMSAEETRRYIERRATVAGAKQALFTPEAIEEIFVYAQGVPRVINMLCDLALLFGYADAEREIKRSTIQQAAENLNLYVREGSLRRQASRPQEWTNEVQHGDAEPLQRLEKRLPWPGAMPPGRLVRRIGFVVAGLLLGGIALGLFFNSHTLQEYTAKLAPYLRLSSPGTPSSMPSGAVQWAQNSVFHQLPTGEPFSLSLPALQNTREGFPVEVTLDTLSNVPGWLEFDPTELRLRGVAPSTEAGKIYTLAFRAHTTNGLESLLQLHVALIGQTKSALSPAPETLQQR